MPELQPLRVLLLEDAAADAALIEHELRQAGYAPTVRRVDNEADYQAALRRPVPPEVILADYYLPSFDAPQALRLRAASPCAEVPFIVVSGAAGEDAGVECMKQGATDYLLKDRLARLGPAIAQALANRKLQHQNRATREALHLSETRLLTVVMGAPIILFALNQEGVFTLAEGQGLKRLGFAPHQVVGVSVNTVFGHRPEITTNIQRALAGQEIWDVVQVAERVFEVRYSPLRDAEESIIGLIGVAIDITERKHGEQVQAALYRISEAAQMSTSLEALYPALHAIISDLMPAQNFYIALYEAATQTLTFPYYVDTYDVVSPNAPPEPLGRGLTAYVLRTSQPLLIDQAGCKVLEQAGEAELVGTDSLEWLGVPLHVQNHTIGAVVVQTYSADVRLTDEDKELLIFVSAQIAMAIHRKQAEEALRQAQKMESLGVLAGGIAHDFNNLLVAMLGQASVALAQLPADHPARAAVQKAAQAAQRAADLTRQLLAYSGRGQFAIRPLQLNDLILENTRLLEVSLPKAVQLQTDLLDDLPLIDADAGQMQQVLMNLVINAAEAMGDQPGIVLVHTRREAIRAGDGRFSQLMGSPLPPGLYVLLEVRDNGSGMDEQTLAKIFDPFFTTKFTGRGLGLAAVLGIVRGHQGGLQVQTSVGQGTLFRLAFPARAESAPPVPVPAPAASLPAAPRYVLVIDDEESVRMAVMDILDFEGVPVLSAASGADGLVQYQAHQSEIALVLLDLSMPGLSGEETFHALRQINPEVRVVLSSGYSQTETVRRFAHEPVAGFLQKPYDLDQLITTVRRHAA